MKAARLHDLRATPDGSHPSVPTTTRLRQLDTAVSRLLTCRQGNDASMSEESRPRPANADPQQQDDIYVEPSNSTVDDWHGQVEQRQEELAQRSLRSRR